MSANEWLHFINPLIVMMLIIALITSLPVTSDWRKRFQLAETPLPLRKAVKIFAIVVSLCALCWLPALWALHITIPQVRVNVVAASQVMFGVAIITTSLVVIIRLFHRDSLVSVIFALIKKYFPPLIRILGTFVSAIALIFIKSLDDETLKKNTARSTQHSDEEKVLDITKTNYRGEFCDKDKSNWY